MHGIMVLLFWGVCHWLALYMSNKYMKVSKKYTKVNNNVYYSSCSLRYVHCRRQLKWHGVGGALLFVKTLWCGHRLKQGIIQMTTGQLSQCGPSQLVNYYK